MTEQHVKFIRTNENWYGTFDPFDESENIEYCNPRPFPCFKLTVSKFPGKDTWYISATGTDDGVYQKEYNTRLEALTDFEYIEDFTTRDYFSEMGFEYW